MDVRACVYTTVYTTVCVSGYTTVYATVYTTVFVTVSATVFTIVFNTVPTTVYTPACTTVSTTARRTIRIPCTSYEIPHFHIRIREAASISMMAASNKIAIITNRNDIAGGFISVFCGNVLVGPSARVRPHRSQNVRMSFTKCNVLISP